MTRNYFDDLVRALENGLQEVDSSKSAVKKKVGEIASYRGRITYADYVDEDGNWLCGSCTYINRLDSHTCKVCESDRPK